MKEIEQQQIFDDWLGQHQSLLFKVVYAYAFNRVDREDLFQEIALQVWRSIPNFQQQSAVTTWLYRLSLNTALTWKRKEQKHVSGRQSIKKVEHLLHENIKNRDERLVWLYEEIAGFNEIDRSLILLLLDGFSYKEMAQILGITEANIGVKIHRIKKQLILKSEKHTRYGV